MEVKLDRRQNKEPGCQTLGVIFPGEGTESWQRGDGRLETSGPRLETMAVWGILTIIRPAGV